MDYITNSLYGNILFSDNVEQAIKYIAENDKRYSDYTEKGDPNDPINWIKIFGIGISRDQIEPLRKGSSDLVKWLFVDEIHDKFVEDKWVKAGNDMELRKIINVFSSWHPDVIYARYSSLDHDVEGLHFDLLESAMMDGISVFLICDNDESLDDIKKRMLKPREFDNGARKDNSVSERLYSLDEIVTILENEHPMGIVDLRKVKN